ncbi:MAG: DUF4214 domain-containing protein [Telluria sp.]
MPDLTVIDPVALHLNLSQYYVTYLGRPADPDGLAYWAGQVAQGHLGLAQAEAVIGASPEAQALLSANAQEEVTRIYDRLFSRAPDAEGLQYWSHQIESGALAPAAAIGVIAHAAVGADANALFNKAGFALAFTNAVQASGTGFDWGSARVDGFLQRDLHAVTSFASYAAAVEPNTLHAELVEARLQATSSAPAETNSTMDAFPLDVVRTIEALYVGAFGRPADIQGLAYFGERLVAGTATQDSLAYTLTASDEFKKATAGLDAMHVVDLLSENLFHEAPSAANLVQWTGELGAGTTAGQLMLDMIGRPPGAAEQLLFAERVSTAQMLSYSMDTASEIIAYSGDVGVQVYRAFLAGVSDEASYAAAVDPSHQLPQPWVY